MSLQCDRQIPMVIETRRRRHKGAADLSHQTAVGHSVVGPEDVVAKRSDAVTATLIPLFQTSPTA